MEVKASLKQLRIAPRKVRVVADQIRGKSVPKAIAILEGMSKRGAMPMLKLLQSAVANAKHNNQLAADTLVVKAVTVNEGVMLKRFMPRAFGRAAMIRKRSSHVEITLDVNNAVKAQSAAAPVKEAPKAEAPKAEAPKKEAKKADKPAKEEAPVEDTKESKEAASKGEVTK